MVRSPLRLSQEGPLLLLLSLVIGGLASVTTLMSLGVVFHTVKTLEGPWHLICIQLLLAGFVITQGGMTVTHLVLGKGRERTLFQGAMVLFGLGLLVTVKSSYNAWTRPDPEYWVVMLGLLMMTQAAGTMLRVGQWKWRRDPSR